MPTLCSYSSFKDSTDLLNDRSNKTIYPDKDEYLDFNSVHIHKKNFNNNCAVVTYGTGVKIATNTDLDIIEINCLSNIPKELPSIINKYQKIIFADPCKLGSGPLAYMAVELKNRNSLPKEWFCVSAPKLYHPLGQKLNNITDRNSTFLTENDILKYV